jgi:hypothetical protein
MAPPFKISPAVSAFQFQGGSRINTNVARSPAALSPSQKSADYFNQDYYSFSPTTPIVNTEEQDSYVYKNQVVTLDQETKQKLTSMGSLPLESEWTFWFDK